MMSIHGSNINKQCRHHLGADRFRSSRPGLGHGTAGSSNDDAVVQNIDKILAMELNRLSLQDREAMNEEIHGVNFLAVPETPEVVADKLYDLDQLLKTEYQPSTSMTAQPHQGPVAYRNAYEEAHLLGSQYIHEPEFRIMFLRADFFDVGKAARRMVGFLQLIRDYLGVKSLLRLPFLSLNDLTADEIHDLKRGPFFLFPGRDGAGRRVSGFVGDTGNLPLASMVR
jgi:hypothetical protein